MENIIYQYKPPIGSTLDHSHPLVSHLKLCYLINEVNGKTLFDLCGKYNATIFNGAYVEPRGLYLDGVNGYAEIISNGIGHFDLQEFSIEVRFRNITDPDNSVSLWSYSLATYTPPYYSQSLHTGNNGSDNDVFFGFNNTGTFNFIPHHNFFWSSLNYNHVIVTYKSGQQRMYFNGRLVQSSTYTGNITYYPTPVRIGKETFTTTGQAFISDVRFYTRALTIDEANSLFVNPYQFIKQPAGISNFALIRNQIKTSSILSQESMGYPVFPGKITLGPGSIQSSESFSSNTLQHKNLAKNNVISSITFDNKIETCNLNQISFPTNITGIIFGTSGSVSYKYKISSANKDGETLASSFVTINSANTILDSNNFIRLRWNRVEYATHYFIYGRSNNEEKLIAKVYDIFYDDKGTPLLEQYPKTINTTGYNPHKLNIGNLIKLYTSEAKSKNYLSALQPEIIYNTYSVAGYGSYIIDTYKFSENITWIFYNDNRNSNTNAFSLYVHNRLLDEVYLKGGIFISRPSNFWDDGFKVTVDFYTTGTISGTGSTITGFNTLWISEKISVGARIGIGSYDPEFITEWYEISAISSNTSITISQSLLKTIPANTPYVIEEIRIIQFLNSTSNSTLNGIFVTKGLNYEVFDIQFFTIPMATTVDGIRATYILRDAASSTSTNIQNGFVADKIDANNQFVYLLHAVSGTAAQVFKFNLRSTLTSLSSGVSLSAYIFKTAQVTLPESFLGRDFRTSCMAKVKNGIGNNEQCLYFCSGSYTYRITESSIGNNVPFYFDRQLLYYPYGEYNFSAGSFSVRGIDYDALTDRFVTSTYQGHAGTKNRIFRYDPAATEIEASLGIGDHYGFYFDVADLSSRPYSSASFNTATSWASAKDGLYYRTQSAYISIVNFAADFLYADLTNNYAITPIISCPNNLKFEKITVDLSDYFGEVESGLVNEPYRIYYRTSGILDNSGNWTIISQNGNLSSVSPSEKIQFKIVFRTLGGSGWYAQIHSLNVHYKRNEYLTSELSFNTVKSIIASNIAHFDQICNINKTLPLTVDIYNNNSLALTQSTELKTHGLFESNINNSWNVAHFIDKSLRKKSITNVGVTYSSQSNNNLNSAYFDGSSYLRVNNHEDFSFSGEFQIDFYLKLFGVNDFGGNKFRVLSFGGENRNSGWEICKETISSVEKLVFYIGNTSSNLKIPICDISQLSNSWNRVTVLRKNDKIGTYINGNRTSLETYNLSIINNSDHLYIGSGELGNSNHYFKGYINNLVIFKKSFTLSLTVGQTAGSNNGFITRSYSGYWNSDVNFFGNNTYNSQLNTTFIYFDISQNTSISLFGYLLAPVSGVYNFSMTNDDNGYAWIGDNALNPTMSNPFIGSGIGSASASISLVAGTAYPLRIYVGNGGGPGYLYFDFTLPTGTKIPYEFTGYVFTSVNIITDDYLVDTYKQFNPNFRIFSNANDCSLYLDFQDITNQPGIERRFTFNSGILNTLDKVKISLK
jgi:hypothetical protein